MNVDTVKVKCVACLQGTVGYVGAFDRAGRSHISPWTTELLHSAFIFFYQLKLVKKIIIWRMFQKDFFIRKVFGQVSYRIRMFSFIFPSFVFFFRCYLLPGTCGRWLSAHITQRHANKTEYHFRIIFSIHSWLYLYISLIFVDVTCLIICNCPVFPTGHTNKLVL